MQETNKWGDIENDFPYQDILYLEHPTPRHHPRQDLSLRAGQFSPFAALTGYDGQLKEVSRYVSSEIYLTDSEKEQLDEQIHFILQNQNVQMKVTYFQKDLKKNGGTYQIKMGSLYRVDPIYHFILFQDKTKIRMQDIVKIEIIESPD